MAEEGKATPQPQEQPEMTGKDVSDEIQDIKESKESEVCEPSAEDKEKATEFKNAGNVLYKKNAFAPAIAMYSKAIEKDPTNAVFWSNRAICYIKTEAPGAAVSDATKAIEADRKYIKGYYRRGTAFLMMSKYKKALKDFKQVAKMYPKNKEAKQKARQCERALREAMFAKAIQAEASKPPSEVLDWRNMSVPSSYTGPRWEEEDAKMSPAFIEELIAFYKASPSKAFLAPKYAYRVMLEAIALFKTLPPLVDIDVPENTHFTVCGDVHGQFYDLLNIFKLNGMPSATNPYLFNGDFVDRGSFSIEIIMLFLCLKLAHPQSFHMLRGNHETINMNNIYGFKGEVQAKVDTGKSFDLFTEVFNWIPLGAVIGKKAFVTHGGLFSEDGVTLDDLRKIDRVRQPPETGLMCEMMWADPQPGLGRAPSKRGVGLAFGPDVTSAFLETNDLSLVIRSHEVKQEGYEVMHDGQLVTVFSAPNYCDTMGNKGAFITLDHNIKPTYTTFTHVEHPPIKPMAYANQMYRMGM